MWAKVAEEMAVPWRAAEAMHWQLGEAEMARRAGVVPFSLSSVPVDAPLQAYTLHQHEAMHIVCLIQAPSAALVHRAQDTVDSLRLRAPWAMSEGVAAVAQGLSRHAERAHQDLFPQSALVRGSACPCTQGQCLKGCLEGRSRFLASMR